MAYLNHNIPTIRCMIRNEFLFNHTKGYGEFTNCDVHMVASMEGMTPVFEAFLENGVNWTRRPIHAFCWKKDAPNDKERALMLKKCGKKFFLGPGTSFPICTCGTCFQNRRGVQSAYSRAREWAAITAKKKHTSENAKAYRKYVDVARRAKRILKNSTRRK